MLLSLLVFGTVNGLSECMCTSHVVDNELLGSIVDYVRNIHHNDQFILASQLSMNCPFIFENGVVTDAFSAQVYYDTITVFLNGDLDGKLTFLQQLSTIKNDQLVYNWLSMIDGDTLSKVVNGKTTLYTILSIIGVNQRHIVAKVLESFLSKVPQDIMNMEGSLTASAFDYEFKDYSADIIKVLHAFEADFSQVECDRFNTLFQFAIRTEQEQIDYSATHTLCYPDFTTLRELFSDYSNLSKSVIIALLKNNPCSKHVDISRVISIYTQLPPLVIFALLQANESILQQSIIEQYTRLLPWKSMNKHAIKKVITYFIYISRHSKWFPRYYFVNLKKLIYSTFDDTPQDNMKRNVIDLIIKAELDKLE